MLSVIENGKGGVTMSGHTPLGNLCRIAAVLVVGYALVYALVSFSVSEAGPHYVLGDFQPSASESIGVIQTYIGAAIPQVRCGAAVVDAWHSTSVSRGWFGYAPLSAVTPAGGSGCREAGQHRLRLSALAVFVAIGLVLVARRLDRPPGFGIDPAPA
jgi:hypothetical protein